jgi:hypothetical protein
MTRHSLHSIGLMALAVAAMMPAAAFAQAGGGFSLTQAPSCEIRGSLTPVNVSVGNSNGVVTPDNGTGSAGEIRILCNTFIAAVAIGSDAMVNPAIINANEADRFTNRIDFAGYARRKLTGNLGWRIASRPGTRGAWQSDYIGFPVLTLEVFATGFETLTKLPVAGKYTGRICITVSPSGLPAPTLAQGAGGCST